MKLKLKSAALLMSLAIAGIGSASATENGLTTYPIGVNTVLDGILPPPGDTRFYNYTQYYVANKFAGPHGESLVPGFRSSALVDAPRVVHTWGSTIGPFTLSTGAIVPFFYLDLNTPAGHGHRTALGDIIVQPLMLGYVNQSHTFFAYLTGDVGLPTGAYDVNRIANVGTNTYAFMPSLNATWFPTPDWELSGTALVEINSPNHATNYHSGSVASLDWLIGYSVTKQFQIGLQGFYLKQFTDDTVNGQSVNGDGFRGQAVGIGPQIRWDWAPGSSVALKYQHEFAVRNRPQGERIWLEVSVPFK
ncbi:SphA family protein [Burkholderia gladioli]|uniref:Meta-pathway phenol degradation-like protein n=1 Tax=Burkholderia gladioli (strain BSR3) TaxID=999541 RepID=F2LB85_BURGS|nr:transporter [Burkholderia gladioli]AEA60154.1 meta-pathway phenol degradation-like protein [Burkholderia gladioli BSR3]MBW5288046.1 transporter [Burkholderia gladioli]